MKYTLQLLTILAALTPTLAIGSDQIPGARQTAPIVLKGGTIHRIDGRRVKAPLVFNKGRITAIGAKVRISDKTKVIDISGLHVYPSLIESFSQIGLFEIGAVRATNDYQEVGRINPNVRAHVAVNPDSEIIPVTRSNGVLVALTVPSGGFVAGQASVIQLDGWSTEDMTIKPSAGLVVRWPEPAKSLKSPGGELKPPSG